MTTASVERGCELYVCELYMCELYVYYRVPAPQAKAAAGEVVAAQRAMVDRWPGLDARLLRRDEGATVTWMEVYRRPGGLDAALLDGLRAALALLPTARSGPRHEECFEPYPAHGQDVDPGVDRRSD